MSDILSNETTPAASLFDQPGVEITHLPAGVRLGIASVSNPELGFGGAYGTWGEPFDNAALPGLIERRLGEPLNPENSMELGNLGFTNRHHLEALNDAEHLEVELAVGTNLLQAAMRANHWQPKDVQGVLIGMSGPIANDYVEQIARRAGVPESTLKVSVHKACDSSVGALNLTLNPGLQRNGVNLAEELKGKKLLVGGIEGLSRFIGASRDVNALQLFGNGAGVIGVVPGETLKFLVGKEHENFDEEGVLAVRMYYPHSRRRSPAGSLVELSQENAKSYPCGGDDARAGQRRGGRDGRADGYGQAVCAHRGGGSKRGLPGLHPSDAAPGHPPAYPGGGHRAPRQLQDQPAQTQAPGETGDRLPHALAAERVWQCQRRLEYDRYAAPTAVPETRRAYPDRWFRRRDLLRCAGGRTGRLRCWNCDPIRKA